MAQLTQTGHASIRVDTSSSTVSKHSSWHKAAESALKAASEGRVGVEICTEQTVRVESSYPAKLTQTGPIAITVRSADGPISEHTSWHKAVESAAAAARAGIGGVEIRTEQTVRVTAPPEEPPPEEPPPEEPPPEEPPPEEPPPEEPPPEEPPPEEPPPEEPPPDLTLETEETADGLRVVLEWDIADGYDVTYFDHDTQRPLNRIPIETRPYRYTFVLPDPDRLVLSAIARKGDLVHVASLRQVRYE